LRATRQSRLAHHLIVPLALQNDPRCGFSFICRIFGGWPSTSSGSCFNTKKVFQPKKSRFDYLRDRGLSQDSSTPLTKYWHAPRRGYGGGPRAPVLQACGPLREHHALSRSVHPRGLALQCRHPLFPWHRLHAREGFLKPCPMLRIYEYINARFRAPTSTALQLQPASHARFKRKNSPFAGRSGLYRPNPSRRAGNVIGSSPIMDRSTFWRHSRAKAGLRLHVETVVKPWLTANARWALNNTGFCWARTRMSSRKTSSIFCRLSRTC